MQSRSLAKDYAVRCKSRLKAIDVLFDEKSWPDVVRESQEVVELALKALLRFANIEYPRVHDLSAVLEAEKQTLPKSIVSDVPEFVRISKELRRDRELAFYGSEDLTPLEFYTKADANRARDQAKWVVATITKIVKS